MKVAIVHNSYRQRGGEDAVVEAEAALLSRHGHAVEIFRRHNDALDRMPRATAALQTLWSAPVARDFAHLLSRFQPDVVHVHNTFALVSPAVYWVAHRLRVPVVQTLHNFRLLCPQAMFLRAGQVCEDCLGRVPWRGAVRACYRDSRAQSSVLAGMLTLHRAAGTWSHRVTRYIAPSAFCRAKFIEGGLPAARIAIKPHFIDAPPAIGTERLGFLFAGRLSPEKGIELLARAAAQRPDQPVWVAGDGPLGAALDGRPGITRLGHLQPEALREKMRQATAVVVPSICLETFGMVVVEAYAGGTPVIASRIGALADLVEHGVTGLHVEPGNASDLAQALQWADTHPEQMAAMGLRARVRFDAEFTAGHNYHRLMQIYEAAISERARKAVQ